MVGSPWGLLRQGSHGSGRARCRHPAPHLMITLRRGPGREPLGQRAAGIASRSARTTPTMSRGCRCAGPANAARSVSNTGESRSDIVVPDDPAVSVMALQLPAQCFEPPKSLLEPFFLEPFSPISSLRKICIQPCETACERVALPQRPVGRLHGRDLQARFFGRVWHR